MTIKSLLKIPLFSILCYFWILTAFGHAAVRPFVGLGFGRSNESREVYASPSESFMVGVEGSKLGVSAGILNMTQQNKNQTLSPGQISMTPIMASFYFRWPLKRLKFHAGGGFEYVMAGHTLDTSITEDASRFGERVRDDFKDGIGTHAMGGFDYYATRNFSWGVDVIYFFYNTTVKTTVTGIPTHSFSRRGADVSIYERPINLDMSLIFLTIKYHF